MAGYWNSIPRGIWKITEPIDAINALRDRESLPEYDSINFRIHVLGPTHKAVILDLDQIFESIGDNTNLRNAFIDCVQQTLKIQLN